MLFGMLGPLTVDSDSGTPLPVTPALPRTALAMLVAHANTTVPADRLIEAMWPGKPPAASSAYLYNHMGRLRKLLGTKGAERIHTMTSGYLLRAQQHEVDLGLFHEHHRLGLAAHRAQAWDTARRELAAALALWRGEPLVDIARPVLEESEQQRLRELRLQALQWRIEAELRLGLHEGVLAELRALTVEHPYLEAFHGQLMLALHVAGRHADALEAYTRVRGALAEELGTEPGARLRELHRRILARDPRLLPSAPIRPTVAVMPAAAPVSSQLPSLNGEFTGRAKEARLLLESLNPPVATPVLVTGTGGVGKSALACQVARQLAGRYPDGQLYVDLGGSGAHRPADPADVLARLLHDLGVPQAAVPDGTAARTARFRALVTGRRLLLVLDDAADAAQVGPLLPGAGAPDCAVLVTSRNRLRELAPEGAQRLTLEGVPPEEAAQLLAQVVGDRRTGAEPQAVRRIVAACEGLPLALQIAGLRLAARPSWRLADFARLLDDAGRRLDELTVGDLGVRAALSASYRALGSRPAPVGVTAALVFRLAGLWQGRDLSPPAVAVLAGTDEPGCEQALDALVDSHLLQSPEPGRYSVQGLSRLFAAETSRAVDPPALRAEALHRLISWYHHTADAAVDALDGHRPRPEPGTGLEAIECPERPERPALHFAGPQQALRWQRAELANLIASARQADDQGQHSFAWLSQTRTQAAETTALVALGRYEEAIACERNLLAEAAAAGHWDTVLAGRSRLAEVLRLTGRYGEAEFHAELALELAESLGDIGQEAAVRITLGHVRCAYQDFDRALALYREALALVVDRDEHQCAARCLEAIGEVHAGRGRMDEAREAWQSALTVLNRCREESARGPRPHDNDTDDSGTTVPLSGR